MTVIDRLDSFQRRHPGAAFPLAVVYKLVEDRGTHLAALIAYYGFVSLLPLLLLLTSLLGFVLQGSPGLQNWIVDSALSSFPLLRPALERNISGFSGSGPALLVGAAGTIYGGLGVTSAAQAAFNRIYAIPRFAQPNPVMARLRGVLLLLAVGLGTLLATGLSTLVLNGRDLGPVAFDWALAAAAAFLAFAVNAGVFIVLFQGLTARRLGWRNVLIGALIAAALWDALQIAGSYYFASYLERSSDVYGIFGVVLGLLVWIYLQALIVILAAEINVVRHRRLYPRALLTPFTDDVELTRSDVRAYSGYARSERYKAFEQVETSFPHGKGGDPDPAEGFPSEAAVEGDSDHRNRSRERS